MSLDLLSLVAGAGIGSVGTVLTSRVTGADARRKEAWSLWTDLNTAVRTGDAEAVTIALNRCELVWEHAGVPRELYECMATTARWYQRYYAATDGAEPAPVEMRDAHQLNVNGMRHFLQRPWWKPVLPSGSSVEAHCAVIEGTGLLVEPFLDDLESGADMREWEASPDPEYVPQGV